MKVEFNGERLFNKLMEWCTSLKAKQMHLQQDIEDCEERADYLVRNRDSYNEDSYFNLCVYDNNIKKILAILELNMIENDIQQLERILGDKIREVKDDD